MYPVELWGYRDVVPEDSTRRGDTTFASLPWAQLSPEPAATVGQSRGDTWSQGQGSGHGRLVRVLNGSGAWRAVVPSFLLRDGGRRCMGSPARRFGRFCGNGGLPGGATCLAATGPGCSARGCGEWASMAGNVPAAAPALGLPFFWGGGTGDGRVSKSSPAPTLPAADRAAFHQLPRQRRWPCQEHSAPCSSPADAAL